MKRIDAHEGQAVVYRPHPAAPPEDGTIVRFSNDKIAFVLYAGDREPKATYLAALTPTLPAENLEH